jgi:hypothetical protein
VSGARVGTGRAQRSHRGARRHPRSHQFHRHRNHAAHRAPTRGVEQRGRQFLNRSVRQTFGRKTAGGGPGAIRGPLSFRRPVPSWGASQPPGPLELADPEQARQKAGAELGSLSLVKSFRLLSWWSNHRSSVIRSAKASALPRLSPIATITESASRRSLTIQTRPSVRPFELVDPRATSTTRSPG